MSESDNTEQETSSSDSSTSGSGPESSGGGSSEDKNVLEWAVTVVGAVIVLFAFGYFVYSWAIMGEQQAELVIEVQEPKREGDIVEIPIEVRNEGSRVAEAAVVEVCAGPESCAQVTFDYIPFKSTVKGQVGLSAPLSQPLSSRMVSYRKP